MQNGILLISIMTITLSISSKSLQFHDSSKYHGFFDSIFNYETERFQYPQTKNQLDRNDFHNENLNCYPNSSSSKNQLLNTEFQSNNDAPKPEWVKRYGGGTIPGHEAATSIARDKNGNLYATGPSESPEAYYDIVTIKYSSDGEQKWVRRYDGLGSFKDWSVKIAIDDSANVYVTGYSYGSGTNYDYVLIKYDSNGVEQWVQRYDDSGGSFDRPVTMGIDLDGDIYVCGYTYNSNIRPTWAVVKYNNQGEKLWVVKHTGTGDAVSLPISLAIDNQRESIYLVGYSSNTGTSYDYTTMKCTFGGEIQWIKEYDGPSHSIDFATSVDLDDSGFVYVTGYSKGTDLSDDYLTIKYNSNGTIEWTKRYTGQINSNDGAFAIIADDSGNAYVTGNSEESDSLADFLTIKYDSIGEECWSSRYSNNGNNSPQGFSQDDSGNVIVTGITTTIDMMYCSTVKYAPDGNQRWQSRYLLGGATAPIDMKLDNSGNIFIGGFCIFQNTSDDLMVLKIDPSGKDIWNQLYNGPGTSSAIAENLLVDNKGDVYVTGMIGDGIGLIKLNSKSEILWEAFKEKAIFTDIAQDSTGNIYVGATKQGYSTRDFLIIKYNPQGEELWVQQYDASGKHNNFLSDIAVYDSNAIYIAGYSYISNEELNGTLVKLNQYGNIEWMRLYDGPAHSEDFFVNIVIDQKGNICVTGGSTGVETLKDMVLIKFDSDGKEIWKQLYNGLANGNDFSRAIFVDNFGNVYIGGYSERTRNGTACMSTIKYDSTGNLLWSRMYDKSFGAVSDITVDKDGMIYVTGSYCVTIMYNGDGQEKWILPYSVLNNVDAGASKLAISSDGSVYVVGRISSGETMGQDILLLKFNQTGLEWSSAVSGPEYSDDWGWAVDVDKSGNVYSAGMFDAPDWRVFAIIKHPAPTTSVIIDRESKHHSYTLSQNKPNPFSRYTAFEYQVKIQGHVSIKIYDILGREISTLVDNNKEPGIHTVEWNSENLPSGIYFYKFQTSHECQVKKMIHIH
ncbi:MAG: hypothetical protein C0417_08625 [Chlorobiaceae bacterium]|nr:hypothetical protein [Chlorobiaceae bacterium]